MFRDLVADFANKRQENTNVLFQGVYHDIQLSLRSQYKRCRNMGKLTTGEGLLCEAFLVFFWNLKLGVF
jgi:hypothetical protein